MLAMSDNSVNESREVELRADFVELNKLLKFENLVMSGGEAKVAIQSGAVWVNGSEELRVRRKLVAGDEVRFAEVELRIISRGE